MDKINRLTLKADQATASTLKVQDNDLITVVSGNRGRRLGLKNSPKMQDLIEAIAAKHGINLYEGHPYIELGMKSLLWVAVEAGPDRVSVRRLLLRDGKLAFNPEIVFFVDEDWFPVAIAWAKVKERKYVDNADWPTKLTDPDLQADLAHFADELAQILREQKYLELGILISKWQDE